MDAISELKNIVYRKTDNIVARKIVDEMILVPIHGNLADMQRIFSFNSVAEHIWHKLDGKRTVNDILEDLLKNFAVNRDVAEKDILEFLDQLIELELIAGD